MTDRLVAGAVYLAAFVMLLVGVGSALLATLFFILTFTMDPSSGSATPLWIGMVASGVLAVAPFVVCAVMAVRYASRRRAQAAVPVAVSDLLLGLFAVPAGPYGCVRVAVIRSAVADPRRCRRDRPHARSDSSSGALAMERPTTSRRCSALTAQGFLTRQCPTGLDTVRARRAWTGRARQIDRDCNGPARTGSTEGNALNDT